MAVTYVLKATSTDLPGAGGAFNVELSEGAATAATLSSGSLSAGTTASGHAFTVASNPSTDGTSTGTFTVKAEVVTAQTDFFISVALARVNSAGTVQGSETAASTEQQTVAGVTQTHTFTNPTALGTWAAGDRLRVRFIFRRAAGGHGNSAVTIGTGSDTNDTVAAPWTIAAAFTLSQSGARGRNDNGSETTATWIAALNTGWAQLWDATFRVRFLVQATTATAGSLTTPQLQYSRNGGAYTDVTATSAVVRASASPNIADGVATTAQLGGTGTFAAGSIDEVDGAAATVALAASGNTEVEYSVQVRSADTANGDSIQLRVVGEGTAGTLFTGTYTTPTVTVWNGQVVTKQNTFESGQADGTAISVANSGGAAGDAFTAVGGTAPTYQSAAAMGGSLGMRSSVGGTAGTSLVYWTIANTDQFIRFSYKLPVTPAWTGNIILCRWSLAGTQRGSLRLSPAGVLTLVNSAGVTVATFTNTLTVGTSYRVEARCVGNATTGSLEARLYDSLTSTTALETQLASNINTAGALDRIEVGHTGTGIANLTQDFDDLAVGTDWIGPVAGGGTSYTQTITDAVGVADAAGQALAATQTVTDPVGVLDAAGQALAATQTVTDPVGVADAATYDKSILVTVTDPVGVADSRAQVLAAAQTVTDPEGIADTAAQTLAATQTVTDPVGIADAASQTFTPGGTSYTQTITDPVGIADAGQFADIAATLTDPVGLLDVAAQALDAARVATDPVGVLDTTQQQGSGVTSITVTDLVGVGDPVTQQAAYSTAITDPAGITDAVGQQTDTARTPTDPVGLADSQLRDLTRPLADPVGLVDSTAQALVGTQTVTDPIGVTDNQTQQFSGVTSYTVTDPIGVTDSQLRDLTRTLTDPVGVADAAARDLARDLLDPVGVTDATGRVHAAAPIVTDPVGLVDDRTQQVTGPSDRILTDPVGITDQLSYLLVDVTPRWVEGDTTASGMVEGGLVGAGIVEGSASL